MCSRLKSEARKCRRAGAKLYSCGLTTEARAARPPRHRTEMIRLLSTVVPVRVFTLFVSEVILISACFVAAAYVDPDLVDLTSFLLYDSGIFRIAVVVAFIVLAMFARNLYAEVRIRGRLALFQALCMILGLALIGQGAIGYFDPSWIVP